MRVIEDSPSAENQPATTSRLRRILRRLSVSLAALVILIVSFYAIEDWRGWYAWNKFKKEWEAKGEHFDLASFIPSAVPAEENFAMTPLLAPLLDYHFEGVGVQPHAGAAY